MAFILHAVMNTFTVDEVKVLDLSSQSNPVIKHQLKVLINIYKQVFFFKFTFLHRLQSLNLCRKNNTSPFQKLKFVWMQKLLVSLLNKFQMRIYKVKLKRQYRIYF